MLEYLNKIRFFIRKIIFYCVSYIFDLSSIFFSYRKIKNFSKNFDQKKTIIFISDRYLARVDKIAYGLTLAGFNVILFCKSNKYFSQVYSKIFTYKSSFKALWLSKQFKPLVYHVFSNWEYDTAYKIIKNKQHTSKIVFDDYDVMSGMVYEEYLNRRYPDQLKKEKFCLENADGLCCRSLETQYPKRVFNYHYKGTRIFFAEYPWSYHQRAISSLPKKGKTIIYLGNFNNTIKTIALLLKDIGWSIDVYPAHLSGLNIQGFPENIKIFKSVNPKDLANVLLQYDFAIQLPANIINQNQKRYTKNKFYYSAAGKIFDYLEGNLIVIISDSIHQKWILKRYGRIVDVDENNPFDDMVKKLNDFNFNKIKEQNNFINPENLTIEKQISRLLKFYHNLSQN